jgi:hypothetical protein
MGHVGFGEEHVHVARHAARDGVFYLAFLFQIVGYLTQRMLRTAMPYPGTMMTLRSFEGGIESSVAIDQLR